jgi:hypothetical protein
MRIRSRENGISNYCEPFAAPRCDNGSGNRWSKVHRITGENRESDERRDGGG